MQSIKMPMHSDMFIKSYVCHVPFP
jgi:hypothetical protein